MSLLVQSVYQLYLNSINASAAGMLPNKIKDEQRMVKTRFSQSFDLEKYPRGRPLSKLGNFQTNACV